MKSIEHDLIAREREWMEAVQRKDIGALDLILAHEYAYTASGHGRWSRQRWMETLPTYDIHHFEMIEVDVRDYGEVAVVLSHYRQEASVAGTRRSGDFLITDVWVERDGRWQVVTRSSILMPESSDAQR